MARIKTVYVEIPERSHAMGRVRDALVRYLPRRLKAISNRDDADFVVLHVNGRRHRNQRLAEHLVARGQRFAIIQYCLRGTLEPSTEAWTKLWGMACAVWSYLHLPSLLAEDNCSFKIDDFYYHPLGVHTDFKTSLRAKKRHYLIGTSGGSWLTESVREAANAAWRVNGQVFHLGPKVRRDPRITCLEGMSDRELGKLWASCKYVSGLRRTEGFELPAAEGLICGARPVLFDREHYRTWYGDLAEYIPEGSRAEVIDSLEALFRGPYREVEKSEQAEARKRFSWRWIIHDFWKKCLDYEVK